MRWGDTLDARTEPEALDAPRRMQQYAVWHTRFRLRGKYRFRRPRAECYAALRIVAPTRKARSLKFSRRGRGGTLLWLEYKIKLA